MLKYLYSALMVAVLSFGCETAQPQDVVQTVGKDIAPVDSEHLVSKLKKLNENSPASLRMRFYIHGKIKNKQYKTLGSASYSKNLNRTNVTITDFIFRSPITVMYQEGPTLKLYFPVDKRVYIDNMNTIQLSNYGDIHFDFNMLHKLFTGQIPVLDKYRVVKSVKNNKSGQQFLIIENSRYFETVSFKDDIPDKLLFINKRTKEKFEFYLNNIFETGNSRFFKKVRIIAGSASMKLDIKFSSVAINGNIAVRPLKELKLPKNVKIIRM